MFTVQNPPRVRVGLTLFTAGIVGMARIAGIACLAGFVACSSDGSSSTPSGAADASGSAGGSTGTGGSGGSSGSGAGGATNTGGSAGTGSGGSGNGGSGAGGSSGSGGSGAGDARSGGATDTGGASTDGPRADGASGAGDAPSGDGAPAMGAMSFFVSSRPAGNGGDLGGLKGADKTCEDLAKAVNARRQKWVAYLSAKDGGNGMPVNAVDRIGKGPWYNQKGDVLAPNLAALHPTVDAVMNRAGYIAVKPADGLFLDEKGARVPSNQHDILTGSKPDGTLHASTCMDWTSSAMNAKAMLGHSDTPAQTMFSPSWNSAHESQGCAAAQLVPTGGNGRIYCFATD